MRYLLAVVLVGLSIACEAARKRQPPPCIAYAESIASLISQIQNHHEDPGVRTLAYLVRHRARPQFYTNPYVYPRTDLRECRPGQEAKLRGHLTALRGLVEEGN